MIATRERDARRLFWYLWCHSRRFFFGGEAVMHFMYMDESGVEELGQGTTHFILLGLIVPSFKWKKIVSDLELIKAKYELQGVEIHTAWMNRRYIEQESINGFSSLSLQNRRLEAEKAIKYRSGTIGVSGKKQKIKAYRREVKAIKPYLHLTLKDRKDCLRELALKISNNKSIRIVAEAIDKNTFPATTNTIYEAAFEQVVSRYQAYLQYKDDDGIVISDNNTKVAPRLTALSKKFHSTGTFYREIPRIVETPLFVDSSLTSLIQMSDLCAYGLRRFIENNETEYWDIIEKLGDKNSSGICVGIRHYTGKKACTCRICTAHNRH